MNAEDYHNLVDKVTYEKVRLRKERTEFRPVSDLFDLMLSAKDAKKAGIIEVVLDGETGLFLERGYDANIDKIMATLSTTLMEAIAEELQKALDEYNKVISDETS